MARRGRRTLEHVLDEDAALSDLLVDDELLVVGGDEENHVGLVGCGRRSVVDVEGDTGLGKNKL